MLIDIHLHTCRRRPVPEALRNVFADPDELLAMMDDRGIARGVLLCIASPEAWNDLITAQEVLGLCAEHPDRFIPFCGLDPRMGHNSPRTDFRPMLEAYREAGCRGIGEHIANLPFDDPMQMNLFAQIEEVGLPLTFHVAASRQGTYGCYDDLGLPRLEKVLRAFPRLPFLGHSQAFWSEISADVTEETRSGYPKGPVTPGRVVELLRAYPNLWGDLSANSGYNAIRRDPEFGLAFLEEFQDRLLFGTDICRTGQETPIVGYFRELRDGRLISREAYEKIAWRAQRPPEHRLLPGLRPGRRHRRRPRRARRPVRARGGCRASPRHAARAGRLARAAPRSAAETVAVTVRGIAGEIILELKARDGLAEHGVTGGRVSRVGRRLPARAARRPGAFGARRACARRPSGRRRRRARPPRPRRSRSPE